MKSLLTILLAHILGSFNLSAAEIRSGDILLQPLNCHLCSMIEDETKSIYSHMGMAIEIEGQWFVLEAWGKVKATPIDEFINRTQRDQKIKIMRSKQFLDLEKLQRDFVHDFLDHEYDHQFLWDNVDVNGDEKYYCSELIAKLLLLQNIYIEPRPMTYNIRFVDWQRYFRAQPPIGLPGLAPVHFDDENLFEAIGEL